MFFENNWIQLTNLEIICLQVMQMALPIDHQRKESRGWNETHEEPDWLLYLLEHAEWIFQARELKTNNSRSKSFCELDLTEATSSHERQVACFNDFTCFPPFSFTIHLIDEQSNNHINILSVIGLNCLHYIKVPLFHDLARSGPREEELEVVRMGLTTYIQASKPRGSVRVKQILFLLVCGKAANLFLERYNWRCRGRLIEGLFCVSQCSTSSKWVSFFF